MKRINLFYISLVFALSFSACIEESNPPIPAYIYVPSMDFELHNTATQGTGSQRITDAWVSVNDQLIGVDNFPALLPFIIPEDSIGKPLKVVVRPGIENNGIVNKKYDYPFFEPYIEYRVLEQGVTDTIRPKTYYSSNARIIIVDDFESAGVQLGLDIDTNSVTKIIKSDEDVFEGNYSGKFVLDSINNVLSVATNRSYANIQDAARASAVYLEMNYKTELPISVGIVSYMGRDSATHIIGGVNPKDSWNKIYFNFTEKMFGLNADNYKVFFEVRNTSGLSNPKVYIDNIKLVHY